MMPKLLVSIFCLAAALAHAAPEAKQKTAPSEAAPSAKYRFTYSAKIQASAGKPIRVWLPIPMEDDWQKVTYATLETPLSHKKTTEKKFGNSFWYVEGKAPSALLELRAVYEVTRLPKDSDPRHAAKTPDDPGRYRKEDRKVVFADKIRAISDEEGKGKDGDDAKIRAYYDYVVKTMAYDKTGTGWGQGDAIWACDNKRGNCTDFHSLFIALNRVAGVPARFFIGFPIPAGASGEIAGYHCWAEAFSSTKASWIPVDASEAKKSGKTDFYFGHLPSDRIAFSAGRDLVLEPSQKGEPLNYFVYPYAEVDGKALPKDAVTASFHFERI